MTWHALLFWIYATLGVSDPVQLRAETTAGRPQTSDPFVTTAPPPAQISNGF